MVVLLIMFFIQPTTSHRFSGTSTRTIVTEVDLFDEAVECIKQSEGWHDERHHPYVGYGHRILPHERSALNYKLSEKQAEAILREDLKHKCSMFRKYGKDSLLLGVLAYNVGEYMLLGGYGKPKSKLIAKLNCGNRDIRSEYLTFRKYDGRVVKSIESRRIREFDLLFNKTKKKVYKVSNFKEGTKVVIVNSRELKDFRLGGIVGRIGMVTDDATGPERKVKGCFVRLAGGDYLGEQEWFIPVESIRQYVSEQAA